MNKLVMMVAATAMVAPLYAQEAAAEAAPEMATQEQCEIEEKSVDSMMDDFIASKGWVEGLNEKKGKKFFVAKGSGVIQAPRGSQAYIDSRVNAFNKAMLDAKKAMVEYLGVDIATETTKEYAEGSAVAPTPTETQEVAGKLKSFLYAKLNKVLATEGIDPVKDPAAAKAELGKQLNSEQYKKMISTMARSMVLGLQAACTFEGTPAKDKGEIGVIAVWSPKLQKMAESMTTGAKIPALGAKKPISEQVSNDPKVLMSTFGVQQKINENGELVLVGFGQAGAISESKMSGKAAKDKARRNAQAAIREFAGEQVAVASDTLNAENAAEFESGAEVYENESAMREKIAATAAKMNIAGMAPLRNTQCKHPLNGKTVYVCALTWSPSQAGMAKAIRKDMNKPLVPGSAANNGSVSKPATVTPPPAQAFDNQGESADEDAL